ncbi:putative mediator of RNA polymerase II transcription subunit 29 isoform X1 [Acyrthosiphon pisum]|uniref:Fam-b protein n=1 Tax=Acyrthosiphon pisum TaxID=7029 RepID=A0A8R2NV30_ACYPI|nr:putative mediator of RNA polymerase II transcription subunit 29 isoform X1 [Acyrthosiphon pisum]
MDKHIIMLALCLMVYVIGNMDSVTAAGIGKNKFDRLVKCYGQMFENGLIKPIPELYKSDTDTFQTIMTTFYELYEIKTINDKNDDIVPSVNNKKRKLDTITHSGDAPETSVNNKKRKLDTITRTDDTPETSDSNNENNITTFNHNDGTPEISVDNNENNITTFNHGDDTPEISVDNKKRILDTITRTDDTPETSDSINENNITTFNHNDGTPEISVDNKEFRNDKLLDSIKRIFINDFVQNENQEEFKAQIVALTNKIKIGELKEYPLNAFVLNYYSPDNDKENFRTTSEFCKNYSIKSFL